MAALNTIYAAARSHIKLLPNRNLIRSRRPFPVFFGGRTGGRHIYRWRAVNSPGRGNILRPQSESGEATKRGDIPGKASDRPQSCTGTCEDRFVIRPADGRNPMWAQSPASLSLFWSDQPQVPSPQSKNSATQLWKVLFPYRRQSIPV